MEMAIGMVMDMDMDMAIGMAMAMSMAMEVALGGDVVTIDIVEGEGSDLITYHLPGSRIAGVLPFQVINNEVRPP